MTPWRYRGHFPLDRLAEGQFVRSAGDGTGACEVGNDAEGWTRYDIGDMVPRRTHNDQPSAPDQGSHSDREVGQ